MLTSNNLNICKILIPSIIIILLIIYICNNNFENFELPWSAKTQVPMISKLEFNQLNPLSTTRNIPDNNSNKAPNYELKSSNVTNMKKESIYRQKTGRQAYEIEYYVNKYDSNFGGMLGTQMGLKP